MKRRIRIKPRFWGILAVLIIAGISLGMSCGAHKETINIDSCGALAVEDSYYLNIPLSHELQDQLHDACTEFGVDYYVMVALIDRETNFRNVFGDNGRAYGYCQIHPRWWYGLMQSIGATDLTVPKDNFRTGCAIMAQLMGRYKSVEGALVAYNTGSYRGYSTAYSRDVMAKAEMYKK